MIERKEYLGQLISNREKEIIKVVGYKQALAYDENGGRGSMTGTTVYYSQPYTVSANSFTKSGSTILFRIRVDSYSRRQTHHWYGLESNC